MKRAEMLKIIESAIDNACGNDGSERLYPDDSYLAFVILKRIEDAGMEPPFREWEEPKQGIFKAGGQIIVDPVFQHSENAWEPEDETK